MKVKSAKEFIKRKNEKFQGDVERSTSIKFKDIGRKGKHNWFREAWVFMQQSNHPEKVFIIERLRRGKPEGILVHRKNHRLGEVEYRIGYFVVGKTGNRKGAWTWGQFCPLIPEKDFSKLIDLAKKKGIIL